MVRKLVTFVSVLLLSTALFAATPTGTVSLGYATGACPQSTFQHFDTETLDASGNYSFAGAGGTFQFFNVGSYCIEAVYSGDSSHATSTGYTTLVVNANQLANTTTTISVTPNPMLVGSNSATVSGGVQ